MGGPRSWYKYISSVLITKCDSTTLLVQIQTFCINQVDSTPVGTIPVLTLFDSTSLSVHPFLFQPKFFWFNIFAGTTHSIIFSTTFMPSENDSVCVFYDFVVSFWPFCDRSSGRREIHDDFPTQIVSQLPINVFN